MIIEITQYHLPDGRRTTETTTIADSLKDKYELIRKLGLSLTAEVLSTGNVSCTITDNELGDIDISLTKNGPEVQVGIEKMLARFNESTYQDFKESM